MSDYLTLLYHSHYPIITELVVANFHRGDIEQVSFIKFLSSSDCEIASEIAYGYVVLGENWAVEKEGG